MKLSVFYCVFYRTRFPDVYISLDEAKMMQSHIEQLIQQSVESFSKLRKSLEVKQTCKSPKVGILKKKRKR